MTPSDLIPAVLATAAFAALAYVLGMVGRSGAAGGFVLAAIICYCTGWQGFALLTLFVVGGSLLTKLGYSRKKNSGNAQEHGGRRGAKNALANLSVPVLCAALYAATGSGAMLAAFVASLGAAFADTVESEVGQLYGGTPRLITSLRRVRPGTDGAITPVGTLAGIAASLIMGLAGLSLGLLDGSAALFVASAAAFIGTLADSVIGAKTPRIGNEATNLLCTLVAAVLAFFLL